MDALRLIERQAGYRPGLLETYARCTKPVLRRPLEPGQYLAIRYTERLAEIGAVTSVGSRGDSYDCETPACRPAA